MSDHKIEIKVLNGGSANNSQSTNTPLDQYRKDLGGGGISPQAQATMAQLQNSGPSAIPMSDKERRDTTSWLLQRNINEKQYNSTLNERLNILRDMSKYDQGSGSGGNGGGNNSGGGSGAGGGSRPPKPKADFEFLGMGSKGWGTLGTALAFSGQLAETINFRQLRGAQIEGATALAKNAFELRELQGDYTGRIFSKERQIGRENAPGKFGMVAEDSLKTIGGTILASSGAALVAAGVSAALIATGVGAPAGMVGIAALAGGAGFLGRKVNSTNANYFADLERRRAEAQTQSEMAEIMKDPTKVKLAEQMMAAGGSMSGVIQSTGFMGRFQKAGYAGAGSGDDMGKLLQAMSSNEAQKTMIYNTSEGVRLGLDKSEYRKEFDTFRRLLTAGEVNANVRTSAGAEEFGKTFSSYFANPTTTTGLEAGQSVKDFMDRSQKGAGYQASFMSRARQTFGGGLSTEIANLMDVPESRITSDNPDIQGIANAKGISTAEVVKQVKDIRHANLETYNPQLTRARKAAAKLGDIRFGVSSPSLVNKRVSVENQLAKATGEMSGETFETQALRDSLLARENPLYQAGLNPTKNKGVPSEAVSKVANDLGENTEDVSKKFETLAGITQKLIDVINTNINEANPVEQSTDIRNPGNRFGGLGRFGKSARPGPNNGTR